MKKFVIILVFVPMLCSQLIHGQSKSDSLYKHIYDSLKVTSNQDSIMKSYQKQYNEYTKKANEKKRGFGSSLIGLNVDVIFGVGFSNTKVEANNDYGALNNTASKTGRFLESILI